MLNLTRNVSIRLSRNCVLIWVIAIRIRHHRVATPSWVWLQYKTKKRLFDLCRPPLPVRRKWIISNLPVNNTQTRIRFRDPFDQVQLLRMLLINVFMGKKTGRIEKQKRIIIHKYILFPRESYIYVVFWSLLGQGFL